MGTCDSICKIKTDVCLYLYCPYLHEASVRMLLA